MNAPRVMSLQEAEAAGLLEGPVLRAREVCAEADALLAGPGPFLSAPEAAGVWARMRTSIDCLLHELAVANGQVQGLRKLVA